MGGCEEGERGEEWGRKERRATVVSLYMDMYTEATAHKSEIIITVSIKEPFPQIFFTPLR
jgi:hypothetical protein